MEFSNDVEKYEIEVTEMDQNNPLFITVWACKGASPNYSS